MTPIERTTYALNSRMTRLGRRWEETKSTEGGLFVFKSLIVTKTVGEAWEDYVRVAGKYAKEVQDELRKSDEQFEVLRQKLEQTPKDSPIRAATEAGQRSIEHSLKGRHYFQEITLQLHQRLVEKLTIDTQRLLEADHVETLKALLKRAVEQIGELVETVGAILQARDLIELASWERRALEEVDQISEFYEAYTKTGFRLLVALEGLRLSFEIGAPSEIESISFRANDAANARLQKIAGEYGQTFRNEALDRRS